jgi:hypothetical protein
LDATCNRIQKNKRSRCCRQAIIRAGNKSNQSPEKLNRISRYLVVSTVGRKFDGRRNLVIAPISLLAQVARSNDDPRVMRPG